ncbi:MAG: HNH endonuclease [Ardenticatenaceae bacterium]|nr:HNH endonuclease [Ardenticatenaceae bacterium]MCB9443195.1 HNH endonuclease [Ardenticatenaceae bacterium]
MASRRNWSRDELILAFNLYCKTPFGQIHNRNPNIIELANLISRTPSSVSWKLANFARLDPAIQARGLSGATHGSKKEKEIWDEFHQDWESLSFESEALGARLNNKNIEDSVVLDDIHLPRTGKERETIVKVRVNQNFFRATVLAAYHFECCITGLNITSLLNASHIVPWSNDPKNRVNPRNGLCLNALHDRAFDRGLLTITEDYRVKISSIVKENVQSAVQDYLLKYDDVEINLPDKFIPDQELLKYHRTHIFQ